MSSPGPPDPSLLVPEPPWPEPSLLSPWSHVTLAQMPLRKAALAPAKVFREYEEVCCNWTTPVDDTNDVGNSEDDLSEDQDCSLVSARVHRSRAHDRPGEPLAAAPPT